MNNITDSQRWFIFVSLLTFSLIFYLLSPVFTPFLVSAVLAYLADPLVDKLERWRLSRLWSAVIVYFCMFTIIIGVFIILIPLLEAQVVEFIKNFPRYAAKFKQDIWIPLALTLGVDDVTVNGDVIKNSLNQHWDKIQTSISKALGVIGTSGSAIISLLMYLVLIPVITFYFMRDWPKLLLRVQAAIPRSQKQIITELSIESDRVLGGFLRGQLMVMLIVGVVYSIGLEIVGLNSSFLIGMTAGLLTFVPYLGFIVGILIAGIMMLVQQVQDPNFMSLVYIAIVFGVGQLLESVLLTPILIGDKIGLHPVAIIFAVLAGGQLFGFTGVLLALPVAAVVVVWLRHAYKSYTSSELYQDG